MAVRPSPTLIEHNWFAVGVDLAIVVMAYSWACKATNWNQDRADAMKRAPIADR